MKKLLSIALVGLLISASSVFSQDTPQRPGGPGTGPEDGTKRPSAPRAIRDNAQFKQWAAAFQEARIAFKTELQKMRQSLQNAEESEKEAIRQSIRSYMKEHQKKQLDFRKNTRKLMREMREQRAGATASEGG